MSKTSNNLYGFFRAKVTEVDIDQNEYGAVRVNIPEFQTEIDPDFDEDDGLIAFPANNAVGGRNEDDGNKNKESSYGWGQILVPRKGDYVWVFFENGRKDRPFYWNAANYKFSKLPPENLNVDKPHQVYTLMRSYNGRVIVVADTEDQQRVEITGKKRINSPSEKSDASDQQPYTIDGNQTVILLDEREGKEKVLIRTHKGDFIHVDIDDRKLQCFFESDIIIKTKKDFHLSVGGEFHGEVSGDFFLTGKSNMDIVTKFMMKVGAEQQHFESRSLTSIGSNGNINLKSSGLVCLDGTMTFIQCGVAMSPLSPTNAIPKNPVGERDT